MGELSITLIVADRPYRMIINSENEEVFRKAAKLINENLKDYASHYAFKDKQDLLAMVAIQNTVKAIGIEEKIIDNNKGEEDKLIEIDNILSDYLGKV